ncbi:radical SAM protein [Chordicoccus furentiruminis]|uniref:radical SAM protein n=1 Tax=Chordicoccus furentiruminis TaxID=2709410 RepID=UPI0023A882DF|nr:radical SAM protein [Chordicoccus furentiruminis]
MTEVSAVVENEKAVRCEVCFRRCRLEEGGTGACGARVCRDGRVVPAGYGLLTALALDPIEKKPLRRFFPGSRILSAGCFGCNLFCPFCQNAEISRAVRERDGSDFRETEARFRDPEGRIRRIPLISMTPAALCREAEALRTQGNIGVAYTYNEPLVGYEFVRDTARLVHEAGMKNVLVSNGTASPDVLHELLPWIDAMNIDIKSFREETYGNVLGGSLPMVKAFIETAAAAGTHLELTALIVPGMNDSVEEMRALAGWVAGLDGGRGKEIPLHVTRFFPRFRMTDRGATPVSTVYRLAEEAGRVLRYVYVGNC